MFDIAVNFHSVNAIQSTCLIAGQGSDLESKDQEGQTPLLLAAAKSAWSAVNSLIKRGADINVRDHNNRNILHLIIRGGGQPAKFGLCLCKEVIIPITNAHKVSIFTLNSN